MTLNFAIGEVGCNSRFIVQILFLTPMLEGSMGYAQFFSRCPGGELAPAPRSYDGFIVLALILGLPSKVDAFDFSGGNLFNHPL